MGADMTGHQGFMQHQGGRGAPGYSEDTGAAMQPHANQNFNDFGQHFNVQQTTGQPYHGQGTSPPIQYASPGPIHQHHLTAAGETFPPMGDITTIEAMKKSGGLGPTGKRYEEMAYQTSVAQEHFTPTYASGPPKQMVFTTASNSKPSAFSSDDYSTKFQKPVQETMDTTPYGLYGGEIDRIHLVGARPDEGFSDNSSPLGGGASAVTGKESDPGLQRPGINLQNLTGIEDVTAQGKIRELEEKLHKTELDRDEAKRSMERSNAMLTNRIRRLETQLGNVSGTSGSEVSTQWILYIIVCMCILV